MTDITPKTPLTLGMSPLTGRIYAIRGNRREDITDEFNRFMGRNSKSSPPADASTLSGSAVSEMEMTELRQKVRRLEELLREVVSIDAQCTGEEDASDALKEISEKISTALAEMEQKA